MIARPTVWLRGEEDCEMRSLLLSTGEREVVVNLGDSLQGRPFRPKRSGSPSRTRTPVITARPCVSCGLPVQSPPWVDRTAVIWKTSRRGGTRTSPIAQIHFALCFYFSRFPEPHHSPSEVGSDQRDRVCSCANFTGQRVSLRP
jgi:hypothetical protein